MADVALIDPKMAYQQHQDNAWREKVCATGLKSTVLDCPEQVQTRPYLVKGLIGQKSFNMVYAQTGTGKTFFTIDLASHLCVGNSWFGRRVNKAYVIYATLEGDDIDFHQRINAVRRAKNLAPEMFYRSDPISLMDDKDVEKLIEHCQSLPSDQPILVIIDTLFQSIASEDDRSNATMTRVVKSCRRIQTEGNAAVLLVHHTTKGQDSTISAGAGGLRNGLDCEIFLEKAPNETVRVTVTKNRFGPAGDLAEFSLRSVTLGLDDEGEPIRSLYIDPTANEQQQDPKPKLNGKNQELVWECFTELRGTKPYDPHNGFPTVLYDDLKQEFELKASSHNRTRNWEDALKALQKNQALIIYGDQKVFSDRY